MGSPILDKNDVFAANGWVRLDLLEEPAAKALQRAVCWASETRWESIRTPHLFMGLLSTSDPRLTEWCRMLGADADSLLLQFVSLFTRSRETSVTIVRLHREFLSENAIAVIRAASERSRRVKHPFIRLSDLLVSLFSRDGGIVGGCFADVGMPPERLTEMALAAEKFDCQLPEVK